MDLEKSLQELKERRERWEQYLKDAPKRELEHQIKMAETRLSIWKQAEKQRREEYPTAWEYIHKAKQRRKQAESDLVWLKESLAKLT
jgi:hypothetical protein